jgi:thiamine-monophosphate kinase
LIQKKTLVLKKNNLHVLGEFGLIDKLTANIGDHSNGVMVGPGDDAAVLAIQTGHLLLATCDSQIEGVHFRLDWSAPADIGKRAAAVNLSDIAAMGGDPRFALVSLAVPKDFDVDTLLKIYQGMSVGFSSWNTQIVGGNTAGTSGPLMLDITLLGEVLPNRVLNRAGARVGDIVCVTGTLGNARAGCRLLSDGMPSRDLDEALSREALAAYRTPVPRVMAGEILAASGVVTACMDISDGLIGDAAHIAKQSNVEIVVDIDRVPVAEAARCVAASIDELPEVFAAKGGEDFELLFTAPGSGSARVISEIGDKTGLPVTVIGEVRKGQGVVVRMHGRPIPELCSGFDHFK